MELKPIIDNFVILGRQLDKAILDSIPATGRIDIEPEDKCVFHDDNDDRPEHRTVKTVIAHCESYGLETEDKYGTHIYETNGMWCLSLDDKLNILKAMNS